MENDRAYKSIFDAVSDGLVVVNRETGRVVTFNRAACAMYGYTGEEMIDLPVINLIHLASHRLFIQAIQEIMPGNVLEQRVIHVRKDGSSFHAEVHWRAFTYQDHSCLLGSGRDVSDRIRAE